MSKKGSMILEHVVLVVVALAALLLMQIYMKRALCGRWRQTADVFGYGRQYDPQKTEITRIK